MDLDEETREQLGYGPPLIEWVPTYRVDRLDDWRMRREWARRYARRRNAETKRWWDQLRTEMGYVRDGRVWRRRAVVEQEERALRAYQLVRELARDRNQGCCRCCGDPAFTLTHGWCHACIGELRRSG